MTIETKLEVGNKIFFIHDKRIIQSIVRGIKIEVDYMYKQVITYICNKEEDKMIGVKVEEEFSFKTKEDLLNSL